MENTHTHTQSQSVKMAKGTSISVCVSVAVHYRKHTHRLQHLLLACYAAPSTGRARNIKNQTAVLFSAARRQPQVFLTRKYKE